MATLDLFEDATLRQQDPSVLLHETAKVVSNTLRAAVTAGHSAVRQLAVYYTREEPLVNLDIAVEGGGQPRTVAFPFCVALAHVTVFYHMQLSRPNLADVEQWVHLLAEAAAIVMQDRSAASDRVRRFGANPQDLAASHALFKTVFRCGVLGLPPAARTGAGNRALLHGSTATAQVDMPAHMVVLLPATNFPAWSHLAVCLIRWGAVPDPLYEEWSQLLQHRYLNAPASLVSLRAEQLLVRASNAIPIEDHRAVLMAAIAEQSCSPAAYMPLEHLRLLYFRLEACVPDVRGAATEDRCLVISAARLFLSYTSPVRRAFVEQYLYPSLCSADVAVLLNDPAPRMLLCDLLLRLTATTATAKCPFYACLCAVIHPFLGEASYAAQIFVTMTTLHMPQAAHFCAAMAQDKNMDPTSYANAVLALARGLGMALGQLPTREDHPVACLIGDSSAIAYRVLYTLRCIVRKAATQPPGLSRAGQVLSGLKSALPSAGIAALGRFADDAFSEAQQNDSEPALPSLLLAEMDTVLHGTHLDSAMNSLVQHYATAMQVCIFCGHTRASSDVCPTNGTEHLPNANAKARLCRSIASECGAAVCDSLNNMLRIAPLNPDTHRAVYEILRQSSLHQVHMLTQLDAPLTNAIALLSSRLLSPDCIAFRHAGTTAQVCSAIVFISRTLSGLSRTYSSGSAVSDGVLAKYQKLIRTLLATFSEERLNLIAASDADPTLVHHIALVVWWACGWLLRQSHPRCVQLKPSSNASTLSVEQQDLAATANALALLSTLHCVHRISIATEKLVGLTVSRLVIDFAMQAPNIYEHLLAPYGLMPSGIATAQRFALPTRSDSAFWLFAKHQIQKSAPFRAALAASVAQSCALRFRGLPNPIAGLMATSSAVEPLAPLAFAFTVEAMRTDAALARGVVAALEATIALDHQAQNERRRRRTHETDADPNHDAASPGRRVLVMHTLQQVAAALQVTGAGVVPRVAEIARVVTELSATLIAEAPQLHLLARAAEVVAPPFAALMDRVAQTCKRGAPPLHVLPTPPTASIAVRPAVDIAALDAALQALPLAPTANRPAAAVGGDLRSVASSDFGAGALDDDWGTDSVGGAANSSRLGADSSRATTAANDDGSSRAAIAVLQIPPQQQQWFPTPAAPPPLIAAEHAAPVWFPTPPSSNNVAPPPPRHHGSFMPLAPQPVGMSPRVVAAGERPNIPQPPTSIDAQPQSLPAARLEHPAKAAPAPIASAATARVAITTAAARTPAAASSTDTTNVSSSLTHSESSDDEPEVDDGAVWSQLRIQSTASVLRELETVNQEIRLAAIRMRESVDRGRINAAADFVPPIPIAPSQRALQTFADAVIESRSRSEPAATATVNHSSRLMTPAPHDDDDSTVMKAAHDEAFAVHAARTALAARMDGNMPRGVKTNKPPSAPRQRMTAFIDMMQKTGGPSAAPELSELRGALDEELMPAVNHAALPPRRGRSAALGTHDGSSPSLAAAQQYSLEFF